LNEKQTCYTIGHSNQSRGEFYNLLKQHDIDTVVDVRSVPYSQYVPEYNREKIEEFLQTKDINYVFKGKELGARHEDSDLLTDKGKVDFSKVRRKEPYQAGLKELIDKINDGSKVTLMCSEKNPFNCHRFVLVSYSLKKKGIEVKHILDTGELTSNDELENKLLKCYNLDPKQTTLFGDTKNKEESIEEGYRKRNLDISVIIDK